jgi:hypothetical protein
MTMLRRARSAAPLALLLVAVAGCPGRTNINEVTQHLQVQVVPGDSYTGYTGTTFGAAIDPGKKIYLRAASVTSSSGEFSWITALTGSSPPDTGSELIVSRASFEGVTGGTADLTVDDTKDLHPFYPDGQNFRVYWAWIFPPNPAQTYPNGVTLTFSYTIDVE